MAESTLTLDYDGIFQEVAWFLGFGRDTYATLNASDTDKASLVDAYVQDGLRQFYYPENRYSWSFFRPVATIVAWPTTTGTCSGSTTTVTATASAFYPSMVGHSIVITGVGTFTITSYTSATIVVVDGDATGSSKAFTITADGAYRFPDTFAGAEGPLSFEAGDNYAPIPIGSEAQIRSLQAVTNTSRPTRAAIRPVEFDPTVGQRFDLLLYPTPDSAYTFSYATNVHPNKLDTTNKYPLGGMAHSTTILESCLAVAEERSEDESTLHRSRFAALLQASIAADARSTAPENLGYNRDRSDGQGSTLARLGDVTYDDVLY